METVQETIDKVRNQLNNNIINNLDAISWGNSPEETLAAIQSAPVQEAIMSQAQEGSLVGNTLGAFSIGAGNMLNNTITGGVALGLGNLGRITEAISPYSGWDNDTLTHLANLGLTSEEAYQLSPYRDSWLTSMGKGTLAVHNAIDDALGDLRTQTLGSDPSLLARGMEGFGSNIGFLIAMALAASNPLTAALAGGALESLSEAGGLLGDAYRKGLYDKGALGAANKSFLANMALNTTLDYALGPFGKATAGIKNPITRFLAGGLSEQLNELPQETLQQVIEQAAMNSLENGTDFLPELGQNIKQAPEIFMQLAPEVALSTLFGTLARGAGGLATRRGRHNIAKQSALSRYDTVTNPNGEEQLSTHKGNMDFLRQSFADDLTAQKTSLQDIINGIYQSGNEELDTNPDLMGDVQRNFAKINTIDEQLEALKNFGKQAEIQNTVDEVQNTLGEQDTEQTTEDVQGTTPEQNTPDNEQVQEVSKPKRGRKKKNAAPQIENTQDFSNDTVDDEEDNLPEFTPTEDTVKNYKAKNVAGSNTARITTAANTEVDVRYRIVDADDLIASTTETGAPNPNYLQELQPRQRDKITSLEQIDRIARKLDPELLGANRMASDGAPVIGSDMMVESGNGRVLGIKKAYKHGMAEHYRDYLRQNAEMFGLTPEDVDSVKKPVLVRERLTDIDRVKFTSEANESSLATMSASENALDDAKKITLSMFSLYDNDKDFEDNRDFIGAVISALPDNERGDLLQADGNISRAGLERVRYAMAAKAYNSDSILRRLSELLDDEVTNISKALVHASPAIAELETKIEQGHKRKDLSLRDDIMQAVNQFVNIKKQKKSISSWLAQPALFEEENEPQAVRMLMEFFDKNIRAYRRMSDGLLRYAEMASNQAENREQVLFEDSIRSKEDMLEEALFHATGEYEEITNTAEERKKNQTPQENSSVSPTRDDIYNSNFKRFFGDWEKKPKKASKVVDENGEPLIVYHGTDAKSENGEPPFTEFDTKGTTKGMHGNTAGTGAWFHSSRKAAQTFGDYVYDVYLNIRNPYIYDCKGKTQKWIARNKDQIARDVRAGKYGEGYDGVIFRNIEDILLSFGFSSGEEIKGDVYIVFDKRQVKSASKNNGMYGQATGNVFKQSANPALDREEQLRQEFKQKIIDAHRPDDEAEQLSHIYIAANRYFSKYSGIPLDKIIQADKLSTEVVPSDEGNRGKTSFYREKSNIFGTVIQEAKTILQLTNEADRSTALHELGHIFLDKFRRLAASGMLKGRAKQDWQTLVKALKMQDIDFSQELTEADKRILSDAHEEFAVSFEKYLMTGKAPTPKLKHVFETFKRWLTDIYHSIRDIMYEGSDGKLHTFDLNPKVREVFDSMLGVDSSADGSISNDESLIAPDEVEQYNQRTYYASGTPLEGDNFDFKKMRRSQNGYLLRHGPAWGVVTTQTKFDAKKYRTRDKDYDKRGRIHFRNRSGKDAHEAVRNFKNKEYREAAEWVLLDLERRVDRDTTPDEFDAIKANLLETYERANAANKIHFIKQINRMTVDKNTEGSLYVVDSPDDDLLLDGNLPLAKQSEEVKNAIRGIKGQLRIWGVSLWSGEKRQKAPREKDLFSENPEAWDVAELVDKTGLEFYSALSKAMQTVLDKTKTKITSPKYGVIDDPDMAASIILNRFGVPGLRVKRGGFYTYVTWNEDMLRVLGVSKDSDNDTAREFSRQEEAKKKQQRREQIERSQPSKMAQFLGQEKLLQEGEVNINLYGGDRGTAPSKHRVTLDMADESYNQVIGKKGALALSEATGDFMIKLNLKRAELMTKAGKTPQQIRLATGWELAQDNEWRYEIPDGKIIQKEIEKILPHLAKGFRFRKIFTKKQLEQNLPVSAKLGDFFDAPELFTAYPQLKNAVITFKNKIQGGKFSGLTYGIKPVDGTNIDIDANLSLPEMQSLLLHEVQHLIQEIEGFARGGTDEAGTLSGSVANNVASELIFKLLKNVSSQGQRIATMYLKNNFKKADDLVANLPENERKILSNVKKIVQQIRHNKSLRLSNIYPFLGGEVEARNVQRRENLTPEQRRSTLLSETEDVHSWIIKKNSSASGQASTSHAPDDTADESYQQIGKKRKQEMDAALAKHRDDMSDEERARIIAEIEKLGESVKRGGDTKVEKIATHWVLKNKDSEHPLRLPEDNYKIIDAIKLCEQHHINPMSVDNPNKILAQYTIEKTRAEKRINPDTVPEFSHKVEYPHGITVYTVDDTKEGQAAVRAILDTHWGKKFNNWCLLARLEGNLDIAWDYWSNTYNRVPKRIAFKDGILLSFCASNDRNNTWWDREDKPSDGIPYTVKKKGTIATYSFNEKTSKMSKLSESLSDGTERKWYENGQMQHESLSDGTEHEWYENGQMQYESLSDGTTHEWYKNGQMSRALLPDMSSEKIYQWSKNGQVNFIKLQDGASYELDNNGHLVTARLSAGWGPETTYNWDENGQTVLVQLPDRTTYYWDKDGKLETVRFPDGRIYFPKNMSAISRSQFTESELEKLNQGQQRIKHEAEQARAEFEQEIADEVQKAERIAQYKSDYVSDYKPDEPESYRQSAYSTQDEHATDDRVLHVYGDWLTPEAKRQMEQVRKQYEGSEQYLKADNKKKSNLDEDEWLAVRTPNFKKWFGDWVNDPEHASKMLDENGEPRVFYRGVLDDIDNLPPIMKSHDPTRSGVFYTSDMSAANSYTFNMEKGEFDFDTVHDNRIYKTFLNVRNPYIVKGNRAQWNRLEPTYAIRTTGRYGTETLASGFKSEQEAQEFAETHYPDKYVWIDEDTWKKTDDIVSEVFEGKRGVASNGQPYDGVIFENIYDLMGHVDEDTPTADVPAIFISNQAKSATRNNGEYSENPDIYKQAAYSPRGFMRKIIDRVASSAKKILTPSVKSAPNIDADSLRFANEETERRYRESMKGVQQLGLLGKIKRSTIGLIRSMKGDFPELSGDAMKFAKEQFRMLQRKKSSQVKQAMLSFTENLRGLDSYQRDLFGRKRLLDDLMWRKKNYPDAELPFGFTDEMLKKEAERFDKLVKNEGAVTQAIKREEQTMQNISNEFIALAKDLGLNLEGVLRNPHYYRHTILEYANAAAMGMPRSVQKSNASLQDFVDSQLRGITGRGYLKRYKGSPLDISTNYVQANGEVRAQMLMDIEVMKALGEIKKKYDIAPKLRQKLQRALRQQTDIETHSQPSTDDQTISDIIPDGYTLYDPAGSRLIQSANSSTENIISMAVDDAARQSGLPLDRLLRSLGSLGEDAINRLLVIPNEIANTLDNMSKDRERGMLGNAAKVLTNWWKKAVLFSPTRNIKYNFRNFTGDLDALIAGNPKALKFFPQAVRELTAHYRGKHTTSDLQDYINRSGGLNIDSMQITPNEANTLQEIAETQPSSLGKRGWNMVKKFFRNEVAFTAWRENLLRYAAYLFYKQDMEQNNGTPSSWGASIKDEVMSVEDIRDRAYKMSNELLGAYDQVSEFGRQLRDLAIPFWSWSEINLKRYYRLLKNGLTGQNSSDFAKRFMLAKSARVPFYAISAAETFSKISLFTMLAQMFNRFIMPDDDDELPPDIKNKPHITLGKVKGQVYYFDRIGALGDAAEWLGLDNIVMDTQQMRRGSMPFAEFMKKVITAPAGKVLQEVNPLFRMPYELATGRTIYPDVSHPRMIRDNGAYIAQTFGLSWPYKAATGKPRSDWDEFSNMFVYSADAEEAAYFYSLDMVRQFQERVLGKRFDGFAQTKRGQILQKLKAALRFNDKNAIKQSLHEYAALDGTPQGLKASMKSMNPLYGLSKDEQKKFMRWISQEDRKYLRKANAYYHHLADKYIR